MYYNIGNKMYLKILVSFKYHENSILLITKNTGI